jgi:hypothetical protein
MQVHLLDQLYLVIMGPFTNDKIINKGTVIQSPTVTRISCRSTHLLSTGTILCHSLRITVTLVSVASRNSQEPSSWRTLNASKLTQIPMTPLLCLTAVKPMLKC